MPRAIAKADRSRRSAAMRAAHVSFEPLKKTRLRDRPTSPVGASPEVLVLIDRALCSFGTTWGYAAAHLDLRSTDFLELLPRESPGFIAFEQQLGLVGGGGSLLVIAESPDPHRQRALRRAAPGRSARRRWWARHGGQCVTACSFARTMRPRVRAPSSSRTASAAPRKAHRLHRREQVALRPRPRISKRATTIGSRIGGSPSRAEWSRTSETTTPAGGRRTTATPHGSRLDPPARREAVDFGAGARRHSHELKANCTAKMDDFPSGYFETPDRKSIGLRIVSQSTGTGDKSGDLLLAKVGAITAAVNPKSFEPTMRVGFAGDIPMQRPRRNRSPCRPRGPRRSCSPSSSGESPSSADRCGRSPPSSCLPRSARRRASRTRLRWPGLGYVNTTRGSIPRRDHPRQRHQLSDRSLVEVPRVPRPARPRARR